MPRFSARLCSGLRGFAVCSAEHLETETAVWPCVPFPPAGFSRRAFCFRTGTAPPASRSSCGQGLGGVAVDPFDGFGARGDAGRAALGEVGFCAGGGTKVAGVAEVLGKSVLGVFGLGGAFLMSGFRASAVAGAAGSPTGTGGAFGAGVGGAGLRAADLPFGRGAGERGAG